MEVVKDAVSVAKDCVAVATNDLHRWKELSLQLENHSLKIQLLQTQLQALATARNTLVESILGPDRDPSKYIFDAESSSFVSRNESSLEPVITTPKPRVKQRK